MVRICPGARASLAVGLAVGSRLEASSGVQGWRPLLCGSSDRVASVSREILLNHLHHVLVGGTTVGEADNHVSSTLVQQALCEYLLLVHQRVGKVVERLPFSELLRAGRSDETFQWPVRDLLAGVLGHACAVGHQRLQSIDGISVDLTGAARGKTQIQRHLAAVHGNDSRDVIGFGDVRDLDA